MWEFCVRSVHVWSPCHLFTLLWFWCILSRLPPFVKVGAGGSTGHTVYFSQCFPTPHFHVHLANVIDFCLLGHHLSFIHIIVILVHLVKATTLHEGRCLRQHWSYGLFLPMLPNSSLSCTLSKIWRSHQLLSTWSPFVVYSHCCNSAESHQVYRHM